MTLLSLFRNLLGESCIVLIKWDCVSYHADVRLGKGREKKIAFLIAHLIHGRLATTQNTYTCAYNVTVNWKLEKSANHHQLFNVDNM